MDKLEAQVSPILTIGHAAVEDAEKERIKEKPLLLEEVHLEKITIDGICGVY